MRSHPVAGANWTACEPQAVRTLEGVGSGRVDYSTESQRSSAHDRPAGVCRGHHDIAASVFPWHFAAEIGHTPQKPRLSLRPGCHRVRGDPVVPAAREQVAWWEAPSWARSRRLVEEWTRRPGTARR